MMMVVMLLLLLLMMMMTMATITPNGQFMIAQALWYHYNKCLDNIVLVSMHISEI